MIPVPPKCRVLCWILSLTPRLWLKERWTLPAGPLYKSYLVQLGSGTGSTHTVEQDAFPTCVATHSESSCDCHRADLRSWTMHDHDQAAHRYRKTAEQDGKTGRKRLGYSLLLISIASITGYARRRLEHTSRCRELFQKAQLPGCRCNRSAAENRRACQSRADGGMLLHTCLISATPGQALTHAITTTISDGVCGGDCGNACHFRRPSHGHGRNSGSHESRQSLRRVAISHGFSGLWDEPTLV
jgi:hypothetical protein